MAASRQPRIELLWWSGCPSTDKALADLRQVMRDTGLKSQRVQMREVETDEQAAEAGFAGSPTILVDGRDVQPPGEHPTGLTCRVYRLRDGRYSPTPDPSDVRDAIVRAMGEETA